MKTYLEKMVKQIREDHRWFVSNFKYPEFLKALLIMATLVLIFYIVSLIQKFILWNF